MAGTSNDRIVFTWEWGAGNGHLRRFLPIANAIMDMGHEVILIVCDHERAFSMYAGTGAIILPAPMLSMNKQSTLRNPQTFVGLAWNLGANDAGRIGQCIASWKALFDAIRPSCVIADFGLISSYVASSLQIPLARIGLGFGTPPKRGALHGMFGLPVSDTEQQCAEQVLAAFDAHARTHRFASPRDWDDLFPVADLTLLVTVPELDPYRQIRCDTPYLGAWSTESGEQPRWQPSNAVRALAYLKTDAHLVERCRALVNAGLNICLSCDGQIPKPLHQIPNLTVGNTLLKTGLEHAPYDVIVCNANHGMALRAIELARPVLMFPLYIEHRWNAHAVEQLGYGINLMQIPESQWFNQIESFVRRLRHDLQYESFASSLRAINGSSLRTTIAMIQNWLEQM